MATYNPQDNKLRPPDSPVLIGVTIISRATQEFDMGHGEWAIVPCCDRHLFIKTEWKNYTEKFVLSYVEKHYGKGWIVQSHYLAIEDKYHPF
jgi:hypothetical protein